MKNLKLLGVVAVLAGVAGLAATAWAGGGGCCGGAPKDKNGFSCSNPCPLAQQASGRRSFGVEGAPCRDALTEMVQRNLGRI